ncbi:hypothetical protein ACJ41O_000907 [Fusarium nematophilum]
MKLSTFTTAFLASLPFTNAWNLKFYDQERYQVKIHDRSGTWGQPCKNLGQWANKAQSMKWNHDNEDTECRIRLYDGNGCSGGSLGDSKYADWNVPAFSSKSKNKVNSYKIDCREH